MVDIKIYDENFVDVNGLGFEAVLQPSGENCIGCDLRHYIRCFKDFGGVPKNLGISCYRAVPTPITVHNEELKVYTALFKYSYYNWKRV